MDNIHCDFIDIYIKDIPNFYKNSMLYITNLSNDKLTIPKELFVITKKINNLKDLYKMYEISIYWGMDFPDTFFLYLFFNKNELLLKDNTKLIHFIEDLKNTPELIIIYEIINGENSDYTLKITTMLNKIIVNNYFHFKINDENLISICGGEYVMINIFDYFAFCVENLEDFNKNFCGSGCLFSFINEYFVMSTYSFDKTGEINNRVCIKINKILKWYLSKIIREIKKTINEKILKINKFNFFNNFF